MVEQAVSWAFLPAHCRFGLCDAYRGMEWLHPDSSLSRFLGVAVDAYKSSGNALIRRCRAKYFTGGVQTSPEEDARAIMCGAIA